MRESRATPGCRWPAHLLSAAWKVMAHLWGPAEFRVEEQLGDRKGSSGSWGSFPARGPAVGTWARCPGALEPWGQNRLLTAESSLLPHPGRAHLPRDSHAPATRARWTSPAPRTHPGRTRHSALECYHRGPRSSLFCFNVLLGLTRSRDGVLGPVPRCLRGCPAQQRSHVREEDVVTRSPATPCGCKMSKSALQLPSKRAR